MEIVSGFFSDAEFAAFARDAFESLPFFIAIDNSNRIVYINRQYADSLGVPQEELVGKPVLEVIPWSMLPTAIQNNDGYIGCVQVSDPGRGLEYLSNNVCNRIVVRTEEGDIAGAVGVTTFTSFKQLFEVAEEANRLQDKAKSQNGISQRSVTMVGQSESMRQLRRTIEQIAKSDISVCITGETGTGKELIADAIYASSIRNRAPFVKINCAAIPRELLESELFGYAPGAFTGANKLGKKGKFELANGGTILLDEIGEMPMELQSKLLRVLQERQVEPLGSNKAVPLDIRVISSTNRDLWQMVKDGAFRQDLFYRLNTMEVAAPSLRSHTEDIPHLCRHFIYNGNLINGTNILGITKDAYDLLFSYPWPGNVRELQNAIERACILKKDGKLDGSDFRFLLSRMAQAPGKPEGGTSLQLRDSVEQAEREAILAALISAKGNKSAAARILGIDRTALYAKIKRYQINLNTGS